MTSTIIETAKALTFKTDLEFCNISSECAMKTILEVVGGSSEEHRPDEFMVVWEVFDAAGRNWRIARYSLEYNQDNFIGVKTPFLRWDDLELLQEVVYALCRAGAEVDEFDCQHVHVGIADFDAQQIVNIMWIVYRNEELLLSATGTLNQVSDLDIMLTDPEFMAGLDKLKPLTLDSLNIAWFGEPYPYPDPIYCNEVGYHDISIHYVWRDQTVEFNLFSESTDPGEIKSNIQLCLAIAARAKLVTTEEAKQRSSCDKFCSKAAMESFLLDVGLVGPEFEETRSYLLKRLPGRSNHKFLDSDFAQGRIHQEYGISLESARPEGWLVKAARRIEETDFSLKTLRKKIAETVRAWFD